MEPIGKQVIEFETRTAECPKHGAFLSKRVPLLGVIAVWGKCQECVKESDERDRLEKERVDEFNRQARVESRIKAAGIPTAFRTRTLGNFIADTDDKKAALKIAEDFANEFWTKHSNSGAFLAFYGKPGTGKSHLAIAIVQHVMQRSTAVYIDVASLFRKVRETWRAGSDKSEEEVFRLFGEQIDLLVIDEIGVQRGTEDEQRVLFEVLNWRYRELKPTILITNLTGKALAEYLGPRVVDRFRERGASVPFNWESYRSNLQEEL